jgi:hypothetical protein
MYSHHQSSIKKEVSEQRGECLPREAFVAAPGREKGERLKARVRSGIGPGQVRLKRFGILEDLRVQAD